MSPFGRSDSPPASWYEPLDEVEAGYEPEPVEDFAVVSGIVCWHAGTPTD